VNIKKAFLITLSGMFLLTSCNLRSSASPTTPDSKFLEYVSAETPFPIIVATLPTVFTPTATQIPPVVPNFCSDPVIMPLIDSLKTSILSTDGELLSSLVALNGLEVRYFRNGNVVTYTPYQASFLFETTFKANWGKDPSRGI